MGYQLLLWLVVYQSLGHMAADFYQCTCLKKNKHHCFLSFYFKNVNQLH